MLLRFACSECNTVLVTRAGYGDGPVSCRLCGAQTEPPETPATAPPRPSLWGNERQREDTEALKQLAVRAQEDAHPIALVEARQAAGKGIHYGMVITMLGATAAALGISALVSPTDPWLPRYSATVAAGLGVFATFMGIAIWRLGAQNVTDEYRRRLPMVADRMRRQYLDAQVMRRAAGAAPVQSGLSHTPTQLTPLGARPPAPR